ncbi:hypothetical protein INS49_007494 [Diaporthe citri]|uniref:uncharacterized protein n=1 Tax=Diaporthe citri TaxID=83186 RepID=UPI001C7F94EE|nr:uncharacterized protein INS49_007494 [Diaporthe citri]KAG6353322.1 hypothetical protein INS49_007494 [Diaporthe citri]
MRPSNTIEQWQLQHPHLQRRRARPQGPPSDLPSSSFIDYSLHQDPSAAAGLGLDPSGSDFLSPLLWSGNTTGATYAAQDPLSFGQAWEPSGDTFTSAVPPLDLDFTFDPALIDALPEPTDIPDFFIDPPRHVNASLHPHMLTSPQTLEPITTTAAPAAISATATTAAAITTAANTTTTSSGSKSPASSLSDYSPRPVGASGAGRQPAKPHDDPDVVLKRQRNTIAARKYRQKRLDRIQELEDALEGVTRERDDLKLRLARQEAETAALKEMMRMNSGQDRDRN